MQLSPYLDSHAGGKIERGFRGRAPLGARGEPPALARDILGTPRRSPSIVWRWNPFRSPRSPTSRPRSRRRRRSRCPLKFPRGSSRSAAGRSGLLGLDWLSLARVFASDGLATVQSDPCTSGDEAPRDCAPQGVWPAKREHLLSGPSAEGAPRAVKEGAPHGGVAGRFANPGGSSHGRDRSARQRVLADPRPHPPRASARPLARSADLSLAAATRLPGATIPNPRSSCARRR